MSDLGLIHVRTLVRTKSPYLLTVSTMRTVSSRLAWPFSLMSLLVLGSSIRFGSRIITCFFPPGCWASWAGLAAVEELLAELTFLRLEVEGRTAVELLTPPGVGDRGETLWGNENQI